MSVTEEQKRSRKDALKALRESRRSLIEEASRRMKEHKKAMDAVRSALLDGPGTIPELAQATGLDTSRTLWIVATMKKYGEVAEGEKDGSYFRYNHVGTTE